MSVTFDVSKVRPGDVQDRDTQPAREVIGGYAGPRVEAGACNLHSLRRCGSHPFVMAAYDAFSHHRPLTLSPDDVWLCIAQGFAQHVDLEAERLRSRFVRHQGKVRIEIVRPDLVKGSPDNDWPGVFGEFSDAIAGHVGKLRDLVVADFSTTGPIERAASEVVLMSALKHYFEYCVSLCGIPRITLLGTPADWQSVRHRAHHLAEYGLEWWVRAMAPALDELCAAATGNPNIAMWQSFYKYRSESGGADVTGWINTLFPYLRSGKGELRRNRYLESWHGAEGPDHDNFPSGLSLAPFAWNADAGSFAMELVAGFMAISDDGDAVRPAIGWAVREAARR